MTRISTNLGGAAPSSNERGVGGVPPGGQPERWREQYQAYVKGSAGIDWASPEYATPQPSPNQRFGRRMDVKADVPELPIERIRVRAVPPRTYYDGDGHPIPADWSLVPMTGDIMDAVKNGDLEQDKSYKGDQDQPQQGQQQVRPRRHQQPAAE